MSAPELTRSMLQKIVGASAITQTGTPMRSRQDNIMDRTAECLNAFGRAFGLDRVNNLSRFIGQISVECDYYKTTKEYASGSAYEGRKDLGNTQTGDGVRFRGRGLIQCTGRSNVSRFNTWAKTALKGIIADPIPDFVANPQLLEQFPWAFWSAVWYWEKGNPTGKSLNWYAEDNNDEMITRRINGGLTHYDRRLNMTASAGLILLGYANDTAGIKRFQRDEGLDLVDGLFGMKSREALFKAMVRFDNRVPLSLILSQQPVSSVQPMPPNGNLGPVLTQPQSPLRDFDAPTQPLFGGIVTGIAAEIAKDTATSVAKEVSKEYLGKKQTGFLRRLFNLFMGK